MKIRAWVVAVLLWVACPTVAAAQPEVDASRIYLGLSGSTLTFLTGSGSPEGVTTAPVNSQYYDYATGHRYRKNSGSGNTGWVLEAGTVTSVALTFPTGLSGSGCTITTSGTCAISLTSGYMIPGGGNAGDWLKSNGASAPSFAAPAALTKADDTNVTLTLGGAASTALLNAASITAGWTGQLSVARGGTGAGTWATNGVLYGQGTSALAITAQGGTNTVLTANGGAPSFSSTPTVTTATATTSMTTPIVYGAGTPKSLSLGGSGIAGCTTNPPTAGNCEAGVITTNSIMFEQWLATNPAYRTQWFINEAGARLRAFNATAWQPFTVQGGPVRLGGGGVHIGETAGVSDPGLGNVYVEGWLRSVAPSYASRTSGMALDFATGSLDARYIAADELQVKVFIADLEQALAGSQIISKSVAVVGADFTVPAPGSVSTLTLRDLPSASNMAVFESGDTIRLRQFSRAGGALSVTDAYGVVTSYSDQASGLQTWTFTRALSPCSGAMTTGAIIEADALALDYGVSGNGFVETSAIDGTYGVNSPYVQAATWAGCANTVTVRTRVGNLKGLGPGTWGYGLFAGDYAAGRYAVFSDQTVELRNVPVTMYNGSTPVIDLSPTVPSLKIGTDTTSMTAAAGTGMWTGLSGGCFVWRVGDPSDQNISFNSCSGTLTVTGDIIVSGTLPDANNALALGGISAATYEAVKDKVDAGLTSGGNPALPAVATPSGSGLFMGSDYMGYYASGAWKTFIQSNGNFYLGGTGGNLTWVAATSTLTISATLSGNGASITAINGGNITTGTVTATQILANTITAGQIAADTITAGQIAANAITTSELNADSVTSAKIVAGTIVASDIAAGTITANEIAAGTITASLIAAGTITATQIAGSTITAALIAAGTITGTQIAGTTITAAHLAANTITAGQIAAGTITADRISSGTITGDRIAAGTIDGTNIGAGEITADKLDVTDLSAITANLGTVTAGSISGVTMTAGAGAVEIDADGITIADWDSDDRKAIKWSGGARVFGYSDTLSLRSPDNANGLNIYSGGGIGVQVYGLLYGSYAQFTAVSGGGTKIVCADNDGVLSYGCAESRFAALSREVAELRSLVATLLERGNTDGRTLPVLPARKQ